MPARVLTSRSARRSWVSVPVLSNTTALMLAKVSNACSRRTSTPRRASAPAELSMAAGVASDSAHGQVTMSTATATASARV
ncbi:hypothetical protein D9M68_875750 [compost metagenome]